MDRPSTYEKFFPKPSYYPNQKEAMDRIYGALRAGRVVLFEGACGTGKTLSALAPSLAIARETGRKVIIATNVHQQMEQFIQEAREIRAIADIRVAVVKGKAHMCPLEKDYDECSLLRENTFEMLTLERDVAALKLRDAGASRRRAEPGFADLRHAIGGEIAAGMDRIAQLKKRSCPYLKAVLLDDNAGFRDWLFGDVRSPEDIAAEAQKKRQCGYELLKRHLKEAELVVCNYHHLLDPDIRARLLGWMGCALSDAILIFDEAHNLEAQARSHSSATLSEGAVERALVEASSSRSPAKEAIGYLLMLLMKAIRDACRDGAGFGEAVPYAWRDVVVRDPGGTGDSISRAIEAGMGARGLDIFEVLGSAIDVGLDVDAAYRREYKEGRSETRRSSALLAAGTFVLDYVKNAGDVGHYPVLQVRRGRDGAVQGRLELFSCIPTDVTKPLMDGAHSLVLMSATLKPFDMVRSTLGIARDATEIGFGSAFPPERRRTLAVNVPPQFAKSRRLPDTARTMKRLLEDVVAGSDGNVLVFFPSAAEASRYRELLEVDVPVFVDVAGVPAQDAKNEFFRHGDAGGKAVLISYLWGTLTEGVDYRFDRCRTVVIVGVGFPSLNDRMAAVQKAYDARFGAKKGWEYGVLFPTVRRIRQANGRVVRSPGDYGVRVLADYRFTAASLRDMGRYSIHAQFPEEERREFTDIEPDKVKYSLQNFFADIRRMDETPKKKAKRHG